jgi:hypothetical protein
MIRRDPSTLVSYAGTSMWEMGSFSSASRWLEVFLAHEFTRIGLNQIRNCVELLTGVGDPIVL